MEKKNSQILDVKRHLKNKKHITSLEAFKLYGCTRLSGVIYRLKNDYGLLIKTESRTVRNRYGTTSNIAVYRFMGFKK